MSKHQFTYAESFAVWKHHGQRCYWCGEPLSVQETSVDHVIPEHLEEKPDEFKRLRELYGLPDTFAINDFCNWLPTHDRCNKSKNGRPLKVTPMVLTILEKLQRDTETVRKIKNGIMNNVKKGHALAFVMVALQSGKLEKAEILAALSDPELPQDEDLQILRKEVKLRVNPNRWHVVHLDEDRSLAMVSDGRLAGHTPINADPHYSWECPYCGSYGPWNGARCLNCGHLSDPYD
jgi:predicted RNA-binding Zn-ribbon protein involved in translation (DUF1610 family)